MRLMRQVAVVFLMALFVASLLAGILAPFSFATQFRDFPNAHPSMRFLLGTDDLGRDRLSRLLYGTRVSLLLAPAAAFLSTLIAAFVGGVAGYIGGHLERFIMNATNLFISLPWLFLLLTARAALPLNAHPWSSVTITLALLGLLGWPAAARVVCAGAKSLRDSDWVLQARASGCKGSRLLFASVLPNLKPVLFAQFWISVPVFIIAEANLGILGLGVAEPLPSWGNLLCELEDFTKVPDHPWLLAPIALLLAVLICLQMVLGQEEATL